MIEKTKEDIRLDVLFLRVVSGISGEIYSRKVISEYDYFASVLTISSGRFI